MRALRRLAKFVGRKMLPCALAVIYIQCMTIIVQCYCALAVIYIQCMAIIVQCYCALAVLYIQFMTIIVQCYCALAVIYIQLVYGNHSSMLLCSSCIIHTASVWQS